MILGIDPSGNFDEGKGTTGWCLLEPGTTNIPEAGDIRAKDYPAIFNYWQQHLSLIIKKRPNDISMEDYLLYADKSTSQINSKFETVQLIGVIKHHCWQAGRLLHMRNAGQVKKRWSNKILEHKGYIVRYGKNGWATASEPNKRINRHILDAIRHAVHYDVLERGD
jgi:hypothetical protein